MGFGRSPGPRGQRSQQRTSACARLLRARLV
jgi:hypothetical protein